MGNDGGTIAKPIDLLNLYKQDNKDEKPQDLVIEDIQDRLKVCKLTNKPLYQELIMADYNGNLFLKSEVLQAIIDKDPKMISLFPYIKGLNDLVTVTATFNEQKQLICPITKSNRAFSYLRTCGCIINKALLEKLITLNVMACPSCDKSFEQVDIVLLNPSNDKTISQKNKESLDKLHQLEINHNKKPRKSKSKNKNKKKRTQEGRADETDPKQAKKSRTKDES